MNRTNVRWRGFRHPVPSAVCFRRRNLPASYQAGSFAQLRISNRSLWPQYVNRYIDSSPPAKECPRITIRAPASSRNASLFSPTTSTRSPDDIRRNRSLAASDKWLASGGS